MHPGYSGFETHPRFPANFDKTSQLIKEQEEKFDEFVAKVKKYLSPPPFEKYQSYKKVLFFISAICIVLVGFGFATRWFNLEKTKRSRRFVLFFGISAFVLFLSMQGPRLIESILFFLLLTGGSFLFSRFYNFSEYSLMISSWIRTWNGLFTYLTAVITLKSVKANIILCFGTIIVCICAVVFVWNRKKYWGAYRVASACSMSLSALLLSSLGAKSKNKIWFNLLAVGIIGATVGIGYIGFKKMKDEPAADEGTAKDPNNF